MKKITKKKSSIKTLLAGENEAVMDSYFLTLPGTKTIRQEVQDRDDVDVVDVTVLHLHSTNSTWYTDVLSDGTAVSYCAYRWE